MQVNSIQIPRIKIPPHVHHPLSYLQGALGQIPNGGHVSLDIASTTGIPPEEIARTIKAYTTIQHLHVQFST